METNLTMDLSDLIHDTLHTGDINLKSYSPLVLAYIGDCIYELVIRQMVISQGNRSVQQLHKDSSYYAQASTQSLMMRGLQELLTEEEHTIYRRGRNARSVTAAKNQSITDYRRATGFEAVMGYLYLGHQHKRMLELIEIGMKYLQEKSKEE